MEDFIDGKEIEFITKTPEGTMNVAKELLKAIDSKGIIVLTGDLGAGKTKFTEGILKEYGYENQISSPTFTIVNEYADIDDSNKIYHLDVYRLNGIDEFYDMGGDEYFSEKLILIEWGEIIEDIIPGEYIKVNITKLDGDSRKIAIKKLKGE